MSKGVSELVSELVSESVSRGSILISKGAST